MKSMLWLGVLFLVVVIGAVVWGNHTHAKNELMNSYDLFLDENDVALTVSRLQVSSSIRELQSISRNVESIRVPFWLSEEKESLQKSVDAMVTAMLNFQNFNDEDILPYMTQALNHLNDFRDGMGISY